MSRRIRRDLHKRIGTSGYQQMAGDLEVRGRILGPTITNLATAVAASTAKTTIPVKPAVPTAVEGFRSITILWNKQYTLANLSHYHVAVTQNPAGAWYKPENDGTNWGGEEGYIEAHGEMFVHANIPHLGSTDDPEGRTLYYRVRQVTVAGMESEWSDWVEATSKTVQTGDLAANTVYANNILAGQILTAHLSVGLIEAEHLSAGAIEVVSLAADVITLVGDAQDAADAAQADADTAQAAADAAQADADAAIADIAEIASDSLLTPGEKPRVIQNNTVILAEQSGIDANATTYGITTEKTAYDNAVTALTTYLATLTTPVAWDNLTGNTTIVGATFRDKFEDVYTTRQTLLDKIASVAKSLISTAQADADAAQTDATAALATLTDIASDALLSPVEKPQVIKENTVILDEQSGIDANATTYGITTEKTAYDNAVTALTTYLATLTTPVAWNNLTGNTTIVGATFRSKFEDVYTTRQELLDAIALHAKIVNTNISPSEGDPRVYIDDDEFKIDRYVSSAWVSRIHLTYQVMEAKDENGVIIHAIPDTAIAAGMIYGGHLIWKEAPAAIDSVLITYTNTETDLDETSATQNTSLSGIIGGLGNVKGALISARIQFYTHANKTAAGTDYWGELKYSLVYNTAPSAQDFILHVADLAEVAGLSEFRYHTTQAVIPVIYDSGTPYVVWNFRGAISDMQANSAAYQAYAYLYLLGVFV